MSKKKDEPLNRHYELSFTKTDDAVIGERAEKLGFAYDIDLLQHEIDKLVKQWKEEPCWL